MLSVVLSWPCVVMSCCSPSLNQAGSVQPLQWLRQCCTTTPPPPRPAPLSASPLGASGQACTWHPQGCPARLHLVSALFIRARIFAAASRYEEAILHFTKSIELDATNEIYFSNRAAAYNALKQFAEGARDAKSSVKLKPTWAKGWARLGAALVGLEDFSGVGAMLSTAC